MTHEELMRHPEKLDSLLRKARCERAEAIHALVVAPLRRLLGRRPARRVPAACTAGSY